MNKMQGIAEGFTILARTDNTEGDVSAEHDIIWAGAEGIPYDDYSYIDTCELERRGWHFDEEIERWAQYL